MNQKARYSTLPAHILILTLLLSLVRVDASNCRYDEYKECTDINYINTCSCVACHKCDPGFEPYPKCRPDTRVLNGTALQCTPCLNGSTYSENNDFGPCKVCHLCTGRKTMQSCTVTHQTMCSTECADDFELHSLLQLCIRVRPAKKSTVPVTSQPSLQPQTTPTKPAPNLNVTSTMSPTTQYVKDEAGNQTADSNSMSTVEIVASVLTAFFILIILGCIGLFIVVKRERFIGYFCRRDEHLPNQQAAQDPLMEPNSSKGSSLEMVELPGQQEDEKKSLPDMRLTEITPSLRQYTIMYISKTSGTVKGYKEIAEQMGFDKDTIHGMGIVYCPLDPPPGENLLENLATKHPGLTVKQFVDVLESVGRNDIAERFYTELT